MFLSPDQSAFFAAHHGVASRRELSDTLQLSRGQIERLYEKGVLERVYPATYRLLSSPKSWRSDLRAAVVSVDGLASHGAAARLWEIDGFTRGGLEVSIWESKRLARSGVRVHHSRQMHLADEIEIDGIPTTGAARTVLDLFGVLGPDRREQLLDAVLRQELVDMPDLYDAVVRHSVQGRNGVGVLRKTLDFCYDPSVIPDSRWNRMIAQLLRDHGVSGIVLEHQVNDESGCFVGRLDLAIPELKIGIELDSVRWHMNRESFVNDPRRRNSLQLLGWQILNFTWADYADSPERLVATVRDAVRLARQAR